MPKSENRGYYILARGWHADPIFGDPKSEPFCKRAAFAWLVEQAAFTDMVIKDHVGRAIRLKRGQVGHSTRYTAEAWGWSTSAVQRFLNKLARFGTIAVHTIDIVEKADADTEREPETKPGTSASTVRRIITICKYDEYQSRAFLGGTQAEREPETAPGTHPGNKYKEGGRKKDKETRASADDFWNRASELFGDGYDGICRLILDASDGNIPNAIQCLEWAKNQPNHRQALGDAEQRLRAHNTEPARFPGVG